MDKISKLEHIEADTRGGTFGGYYLRKRDNLFARMESGVNTPDFFHSLQAAGRFARMTIRQGPTNDNR